VFNQTGEDREFGLTVSFAGPLVVEGPEVAGLRVPSGESRTAWLVLEATGTGPAEARVEVRSAGGGRPVGTEARGFFPIRPGNPLHTAAEFHRLEPGTSKTLAFDRAFLDGARRRLRISAAPVLELRPALDRLMEYPYGCLEQTTSRLMAIVHAPQLLEGDDESRAALARELIDAGLRRLANLQTESGGLSYWPGGARASRWGTGYAGEFLVEARDAGVEIPSRLLTGILGYLQDELGSTGDHPPGANERALFARVLAVLDRPPLGWLTRLSEEPEELDIAGRAHLAAAWVAAGRSDRALSVLGKDTMWIAVSTTTDGRLTSRVRQDAVLLKTLLELDPAHPWTDLLASRLVKRRENGAWRSTLEDAAALSALARYHRTRESGTGSGAFVVEVTCGGARFAADHQKPALIELPEGDAPVHVEVAGEGAAFLIHETEGLARDAHVERYDRGVCVRREWRTPSGEPVELDSLSVGDLVRVEVTLRATEDRRIGNVAVVDPLPGGFEVENPRLDSSARMPRQRAECDRVEFLDDRVVLFATANGHEQVFTYAIRATGAGSFSVPPVQASCMYEPSVASISGGGRVEVAR
ncbi:MAG: hypothetical protein GF328_12535, partial [Candidatus Latescibacteria bacterium]|nr:hypothetical protein [Candidatus Latescibacterota bacterium]